MIKFIKKCRIPLAILVITFAILFSVFRALTPWVKQYKLEIEQHLSALIGQPVTITTMETSWYWFEPVLKLNQVTVSDAQDHVLKFKKLLVGINLFSSLWHWEVQPGILYAADMHITLRQLNNRWQIDGLNNKQPLTLEAESYLPVLSWLLAQQKIIIKNAAIQVYLKDGTVLPVKTLNLKAVNDSGRYRLKGSAVLAQTTPTELVFLADMQLDPYALDKSHGHAYMSVKHFVPAQWQEFLPAMGFHLNKGTGSLDVWADLLKGRVQNVQAKLDFNHLIWRQNASRHSDQIQALKANLAWQPTAAGWQLSGDQIKLKMAGVRWPVNKILLTHNNDQNAYRFYIKKLLLQPLQAADFEWPKALLPIVAAHPQGELNDTQIEFKDAKINYLLTQFKHLAWNHMDKIPGVSNLSGVLNWQPAGGRLHVDGENTVMAPYNLPKLTLRKINGGFHWQQLAHGYRITMDQLAVIHPDRCEPWRAEGAGE